MKKPALRGLLDTHLAKSLCRRRSGLLICSSASFGDCFGVGCFGLITLLRSVLDMLLRMMCLLVAFYRLGCFSCCCRLSGSSRCRVLSASDTSNSEQGGDKNGLFHLMLSFVKEGKEDISLLLRITSQLYTR